MEPLPFAPISKCVRGGLCHPVPPTLHPPGSRSAESPQSSELKSLGRVKVESSMGKWAEAGHRESTVRVPGGVHPVRLLTRDRMAREGGSTCGFSPPRLLDRVPGSIMSPEVCWCSWHGQAHVDSGGRFTQAITNHGERMESKLECSSPCARGVSMLSLLFV